MLPLSASLPCVLACTMDRSAEEIEASGLKGLVEGAVFQKERKINQAYHQLKQLGVSKECLHSMVDDRIRKDFPQKRDA